MGQVSVREARNNLSQLLRDVQDGEEVVIASHGRPVARLVAIRGTTGRDLLAALDAAPRRGRRRTADQIEAAIQEQRDSWE